MIFKMETLVSSKITKLPQLIGILGWLQWTCSCLVCPRPSSAVGDAFCLRTGMKPLCALWQTLLHCWR